jgi:hypothetical protein
VPIVIYGVGYIFFFFFDKLDYIFLGGRETIRLSVKDITN